MIGTPVANGDEHDTSWTVSPRVSLDSTIRRACTDSGIYRHVPIS